jgi:kinesin family protein 6/9
MSKSLVENKQLMKSQKKRAVQLSLELQLLIVEIENLNELVRGDNVLVDEVQAQKIQTIQQKKREYQKKSGELKELKTGLAESKNTINQCRQRLMQEFEHFEQQKPLEHDLDIGEKFERLAVEKMILEDQESVSFYKAKKNLKRRPKKV